MAKSQQKGSYLSCIRINGLSILPPLITPEKRRAIKLYRKQAIGVEKRLCQNKAITSEMQSTFTYSEEMDQSNTVICTDMEQISKEKSTLDCRSTSLPKLTCDIQSSQYINNEFVIIGQGHKNETVSCNKQFDNIKDINYILPKPQLVRSNSYVLENPSPVLIEHINKTRKEHASIIRDWASFENMSYCITKPPDEPPGKNNEDLNSTITDDFYHFDTSGTDSELKNMTDNECQSHVSDDKYKLKQFIDNNVPTCESEFINDENVINTLDDTHSADKENRNDAKELLLAETETSESMKTLYDILNNIPKEYSKRILQLLEKEEHKNVNMKGVKKNIQDLSIEEDIYNEQADDVNSVLSNEFKELCHNAEKYSTPNNDKNFTLMNKSDYTIYYSVNETTDVNLNTKDRSENYGPPYQQNNNDCLFGEKQCFKENKAASIIVAAAKGYLVRRLMRTERIQNLIEVIKDALMCAMQLHSETIDNIDESDVELHRRLIQQVSAACYAFHDVFFNTSSHERMSIIAIDRQKQLDRLNRAPSLGSSQSNRSTPRRSSRSYSGSKSTTIM